MDTELPDQKGVLLDMYDEVSFSRDVITRFPSITDLWENKNHLHLQMAALARTVYEASKRDHVALLTDVFTFLDQVLKHPRAIPEIAAAITQSFVEPNELLRTYQGRRAWDQMPKCLKEAIKQTD